MKSLTVLSPHQDDAGLSVAMTIAASARGGCRVRIVNCFTVSDYAPHVEARGAAEVGAVRRGEDRDFAARVGGAEVIDLGMEDAPIRLGCEVGVVRRLRVGGRERETAGRIAEAIGSEDGLVLAPLGIGGHIDHLVAREAGIRLARAGRAVAFYEDLPYAAEARECCILRAADGVSARVGVRLAGALMRDPAAAARKRFAIEAYRSQLSRSQMESVIGYGETRGGERLWMLRGSEDLSPAQVEEAGLEAGSTAAALRRRIQCAAHAAANRARAAYRHAAHLTLRGGIHAPQEN